MSIKDSWSGEKKRIDYLIIQNYEITCQFTLWSDMENHNGRVNFDGKWVGPS